jgi:uncharacterized membrane protein (UPF0127 family)
MRLIACPTVLPLVLLSLYGVVQAQSRLPRGRVVFPDRTVVNVEIADTEPVRERGLMFRQQLAPNEGMIFVFPGPGFYPFWMKNTLIPLDMLWVDSDGRIVSIARSVPPCRADPCPSYPPDRNASYVVEVVSGFARDHNLKVGDWLKLEDVPARGKL